MTEVVLDVKLASLGVLNISPRGLTDIIRGDVARLKLVPGGAISFPPKML